MKVYKGWNWKVKGNEDWKWGWIEGNELNEQKGQDDVGISLSYIYYDEREWRYIPKKLKANCCIPFRKDTDLDEWNNKAKAYCIKPDLGDIKYLIINSEDERMVLLEKLDRLFGGHKTADEIALLKSKILTCKQIKEDF